MDPAVTGDNMPEEKPEEATAEEGTPVALTEEKPPEGGKPPRKLNWMLIALIAVSCVAVLLLAATITLAVTEGCSYHRGHKRFERPDNGRMGPMWGPGERRWRDGFPGPQENSGTQNQQVQPPQTQPAPQSSQTQPPAGQGP